MTIRNELEVLRSFAKRLARKHRSRHHSALDIIAMQYGHPHWSALMKAWNNGWCPAPHELIDINEVSTTESTTRGPGLVNTSEGNIAGEPYRLEIGFDYALISGSGWGIYFDHAPSKAPVVEKYTSPNPLDNEAFFKEVIALGEKAADGVRVSIAGDWPRRSTEPDDDGCAEHPLFGDVSAEWHCMHCDGPSTGAELARNMWHCPKCGASPLDVHSPPWWNESVSHG